jgi:hypothetical protein
MVDILEFHNILNVNFNLNRRNAMLGALAAIALVVGSISATAVVTEDQSRVTEKSREPVVEVQAIESADTSEEGFGF